MAEACARRYLAHHKEEDLHEASRLFKLALDRGDVLQLPAANPPELVYETLEEWPLLLVCPPQTVVVEINLNRELTFWCEVFRLWRPDTVTSITFRRRLSREKLNAPSIQSIRPLLVAQPGVRHLVLDEYTHLDLTGIYSFPNIKHLEDRRQGYLPAKPTPTLEAVAVVFPNLEVNPCVLETNHTCSHFYPHLKYAVDPNLSADNLRGFTSLLYLELTGTAGFCTRTNTETTVMLTEALPSLVHLETLIYRGIHLHVHDTVKNLLTAIGRLPSLSYLCIQSWAGSFLSGSDWFDDIVSLPQIRRLDLAVEFLSLYEIGERVTNLLQHPPPNLVDLRLSCNSSQVRSQSNCVSHFVRLRLFPSVETVSTVPPLWVETVLTACRTSFACVFSLRSIQS